MKRIIYSIIAVILLLNPMSCKKDDPAPAAPTLPTSPEALAENNDKSGGVYKGTFASPTASGTVKITLQGGVKNIIVSLNGETRTLNTTGLTTWTSGQEIPGTAFSSADWTATFSAAADGTTFNLVLDLAGDSNFSSTVIKENSTTLMKVYEGTYGGDASGKWNFILGGGYIYGIYSGTGSTDIFDGTVTGTAIAITSADVNAVGVMAGDGNTCSGTWSSSTTNGTWTGARKL